MPTIHEYRREHLRRLIGENGGPTILGKRLGYANGTFLVQMAGPAPMTEVSENTARSFEKKLNLPDRYFDQPVEPRVSGEVVTGRKILRPGGIPRRVAGGIEVNIIEDDANPNDGPTPRGRMVYTSTIRQTGDATQPPVQASEPVTGLSELGKFIKIVGQLCADEKIDLPAKKFADVIALSLVDAEKNHGVPQLDYAKGLLELLKN
jgi:hypothetical protein